MTDETSTSGPRPLAVVTGASSGIGYELAKLFAQNGYDLVIAADRPLAEAEQAFRAEGAQVRALQADLSAEDGVRQLYGLIQEAGPVECLAANAGEGLGHGFLDQDYPRWKHIVDTNIVGTCLLLQLVGRDMRDRGRGRILITGSI